MASAVARSASPRNHAMTYILFERLKRQTGHWFHVWKPLSCTAGTGCPCSGSTARTPSLPGPGKRFPSTTTFHPCSTACSLWRRRGMVTVRETHRQRETSQTEKEKQRKKESRAKGERREKRISVMFWSQESSTLVQQATCRITGSQAGAAQEEEEDWPQSGCSSRLHSQERHRDMEDECRGSGQEQQQQPELRFAVAAASLSRREERQ